MLRLGIASRAARRWPAPPVPPCLSPGTRLQARCAPLRGPPRRQVQTRSGPYEPLLPPPPSSLGAPREARQFPRARKWARRLVVLSLLGGALYLVDRTVYASGIARSLRTFKTGIVVALDYVNPPRLKDLRSSTRPLLTASPAEDQLPP